MPKNHDKQNMATEIWRNAEGQENQVCMWVFLGEEKLNTPLWIPSMKKQFFSFGVLLRSHLAELSG